MRAVYGLGLLVIASACAAPPSVAPPRAAGAVIPVPSIMPPVSGTDKVIGKDARGLVALFGAADQDVFEANARKLQFGSGSCILDAYLYPPARGKEPVVTYIDTRLPDGRDTDRATCVAELSKRR